MHSIPKPLTEEERETMRLLGMMRPLLSRDGELLLNRLERRALNQKEPR